MLRSVFVTALLGAAALVAADDVKCSVDKKCPEETPCCSQTGLCGTGSFCLGGCDPTMSHSLDSCAPAPVCQDTTTNFKSQDSIVHKTDYLGDASKADWVLEGYVQPYDDSTFMILNQQNKSTVLSSTTYMWYGNVKARMRTALGQGVITAFILYSDVKDEIDFEFVGVDTETAQTNYYFQGIPDYNNSGNITVSSDSHKEFHDFEIRWTPDKIEWVVDGKVGRTKERADTWNETTNQWEFPQTPSRVQISVWAGGDPSNAPGTINWAGGPIDYDPPHVDGEPDGYYFGALESVTLECFNAKSAPGTNNGKSYTYDSIVGTNDTVIDGDKSTILASDEATGTDMDAGKGKDDDDKDKDKGDDGDDDDNSSSSGANGVAAIGNDHSGSTSGSSGAGSSGSSSGGSSDGATPANCDTSTFNSDCSSGSSDSSSGSGDGGDSSGSKSSASALAIIIAATALFWV